MASSEQAQGTPLKMPPRTTSRDYLWGASSVICASIVSALVLTFLFYAMIMGLGKSGRQLNIRRWNKSVAEWEDKYYPVFHTQFQVSSSEVQGVAARRRDKLDSSQDLDGINQDYSKLLYAIKNAPSQSYIYDGSGQNIEVTISTSASTVPLSVRAFETLQQKLSSTQCEKYDYDKHEYVYDKETCLKSCKGYGGRKVSGYTCYIPAVLDQLCVVVNEDFKVLQDMYCYGKGKNTNIDPFSVGLGLYKKCGAYSSCKTGKTINIDVRSSHDPYVKLMLYNHGSTNFGTSESDKAKTSLIMVFFMLFLFCPCVTIGLILAIVFCYCGFFIERKKMMEEMVEDRLFEEKRQPQVPGVTRPVTSSLSGQWQYQPLLGNQPVMMAPQQGLGYQQNTMRTQ